METHKSDPAALGPGEVFFCDGCGQIIVGAMYSCVSRDCQLRGDADYCVFCAGSGSCAPYCDSRHTLRERELPVSTLVLDGSRVGTRGDLSVSGVTSLFDELCIALHAAARTSGSPTAGLDAFRIRCFGDVHKFLSGEWELIPGFGLLFVWENIDSCRTVLDAAATATMFREAHASVQAGDKLAATRLLSVLRGLPQLDRMDAAVSGDSPPSADEEEGFVARSLRLAEAVVSSEDDPSIMSLFLSLLTRHSPGHEEEYHGIVPVPVAGRWDGDGYSPEWVRTTFPQSGRDVDTKLARSRCE